MSSRENELYFVLMVSRLFCAHLFFKYVPDNYDVACMLNEYEEFIKESNDMTYAKKLKDFLDDYDDLIITRKREGSL